MYPDSSPVFSFDPWCARGLEDARADAEWNGRELFPESITDEVFLEEGPYRSLYPLPIYEDLDLLAPIDYPTVLPNSLVKVRLNATHHYDQGSNTQSFYLDVQEMVVLRRNVSNADIYTSS